MSSFNTEIIARVVLTSESGAIEQQDYEDQFINYLNIISIGVFFLTAASSQKTWNVQQIMNGISFWTQCASFRFTLFSLNTPNELHCLSVVRSSRHPFVSLLNPGSWLALTLITHLLYFCSCAFTIQLFPSWNFFSPPEHFWRDFADAVSSYSFGSLPLLELAPSVSSRPCAKTSTT